MFMSMGHYGTTGPENFITLSTKHVFPLIQFKSCKLSSVPPQTTTKSQLPMVTSLRKRLKIAENLARFDYFREWDQKTIDKCCEIATSKQFAANQVILSETFGRHTYVYFVLQGSCDVIELLRVQKCFVKVCTFNKLSCFNLGENWRDRQVVTNKTTECLLIPYYWLITKNFVNIWGRTRQFLKWNIPNTGTVIKKQTQDRKWTAHKRKSVNEILRRRSGNVNLFDVPYSIRIEQEET